MVGVAVQQAVSSTELGSPWPAPPHAGPGLLAVAGSLSRCSWPQHSRGAHSKTPVVAGIEVGGRSSTEAASFLRPAKRSAMFFLLLLRCMMMRAFLATSTLLELPAAGETWVLGEAPELHEVLMGGLASRSLASTRAA